MTGMTSDIFIEHAKSSALSIDELRWFVDQGVPPEAMSWSGAGTVSMVKRDRVAIEPHQRRFEFARYQRGQAGIRDAYTVPVFSAAGDVADILAADPDGPIALWRGAVAMAGEETAFAPRIVEDALIVAPTFLDWLRCGRQGVLILHPHRAAPLLHLAAPIRAQTPAHARELRERLTIPAPRIVIAHASQASGAAA